MVTNNEKKTIAILGAGGVGTCAALELAQRGYHIDLYEERDTPITAASFVNEGKIHLGFIYAKDRDMHTAEHMVIGALHFIDYLRRWISIDPETLISTPFYYGIHKGSLMNADELDFHYKECGRIFDEQRAHLKKDYLGLFDTSRATRLSNGKISEVANPKYFDAIFETTEYAIDPRGVAELLRKELLNNPSINLINRTRVESVQRTKNGLSVNALRNQTEKIEETYSQVVNATWNGLAQIDKTMGVEPIAKWSHRYKFGNKVLVKFKSDAFPSCTMVQGPFGDTVNFKDRGMFLSWYPVGRTGWSEDYRPPEWDEMLTEDQRMDVFQRSYDEMVKRIPAVESLDFDMSDVHPVGGVIYAHGNTDVDDNKSKLHIRYDVGIRTFEDYHTVNTGKYTLVPFYGKKIADRIEGLD